MQMHLSKNSLRLFLTLFLSQASLLVWGQQVTGIWKGRMNGSRVELKIIQKGDSLTGTSYYYESPQAFRRYTIKGYFEKETGSVIWWDDQLIRNKNGSRAGKELLAAADFNCPGGGRMLLNGLAKPKAQPGEAKGIVALTKIAQTSFPDEWDFVIDNFLVGGNDPYLIDSVSLIAFTPVKPATVPAEALRQKPPADHNMVSIPMPAPAPQKTEISKPAPTIEEKFTNRRKIPTADIPLTGDSIELRFYDNAEIDGDSISLFLNERLLFSHIRLTDKAWVVKLAVAQLSDVSELTMVAENLGAIPPNTSYMIALCGDKRYEVNLLSTEETSGMIRLIKPK